MIKPVCSWFARSSKKARGLGWRSGITFVSTALLTAFAGIVLTVVAALMSITLVTSIGQRDSDIGYLPLEFVGICVALAGLFFGGGQKLFEEFGNPHSEHIRIGMTYAIAAVLVAVFAFTFPSYAGMKTPYEAYSIPLWVVAGSLVGGISAFVLATAMVIFLVLKHVGR